MRNPAFMAFAVLILASIRATPLYAGCRGCGEGLLASRVEKPAAPEFLAPLPSLPAAPAEASGPLAENDSPKASVAPVFSLLEACPSDTPQVGSRDVPSEAEYLKFADSNAETFGSRIDPELRTRLDSLLSSAQGPAAANAIGVLLTAQRSSFAALYALARASARFPKDPVLANDLGVALKSVGEYPAAADALLYAARVAPDRPIVLVNLGFLAIAMGDGSYARSAFTRAIKADPDEPHALAGLAMLAECGKEHAQAVRLFRDAVKREFFPMAAVGMDAAMASMTSDEIAQDHEQAGALSHATLPPGTRMLKVAPPPIPREWSGVVPAYEQVKKYDADNELRISVLAREFREQREVAAHEAGESFSSGVLRMERWPDKQLFAIGELARICAQRLQELADMYHRNTDDIVAAAGARSAGFRAQWRAEQNREEEIVLARNHESASCAQHDNRCRQSIQRKYAPLIAAARAQVCGPQAQAGAEAYARLYPVFKEYWSHGMDEIGAYYARSESCLHQLDPAWNTAANTWREISIRTDIGNVLVDSIDPLWNARNALATDFMSTEYQVYCPQPPLKPPSAPPTLTIAPDQSQPKCSTRWDVELGVARMRADCRKLSIAYEPGKLSDLIGKSVLGWVHDSITIVANRQAGTRDILGAGAWRNYVTIGEHYYDCGSSSQSGVRLVIDSGRSGNIPPQMALVSDIPVSVGTPLRYTPLPDVP